MKKLFILLTVLLVLGSSCTDFLTVNEKNPNTASVVPASLLLPAALNYTATNMNDPDNFTFIYFWYGLMSCSGGYSQPTTLTQYNPINGSYGNNWYYAYINAQNYDYIEKNTTEAKDMGYKAIAMIMKTYLFQWMVDTWGNVPYTEALQTEAGILKPVYDNQQDIYEDLVLKLDAAIALIDGLPADANELGAYDIVYGGDMSLWKKFANTLKLRLLINQSGMTGRSAYITAALATTGKTAADFIGEGEGAWANPGFAKSAGKMNPFWENFYKQDNSTQTGYGYYFAGQDAVDFLTTTNDPRRTRFFLPYSGDLVQGNYFGATVLNLPSVTSKLGPGMLQAYNQDAPLMTEWESLFLQAEAVERGFLTGDAQALYEKAVTLSIIWEGGTGGNAASAAAYLAQPIINVGWGSHTNTIRTIITQKWLSLNGLNVMPVWTDYRRTHYPDFLTFSADPALKGPGTPPVRLPYPQTELNVNEDNVLANGTINVFTSKIFWDAN